MATRSLGSVTVRAAAACLLGLLAIALFGDHLNPPARAQEDKSLAAFMRKKLDHSSKILEGLTTEDADLIQKGATALLDMSKAEKWNVIADNDYREFNRDFRSSVRKLQEAAEAKNFDNATLQWFDAVKGCVECHKYVRAQRPKVK